MRRWASRFLTKPKTRSEKRKLLKIISRRSQKWDRREKMHANRFIKKGLLSRPKNRVATALPMQRSSVRRHYRRTQQWRPFQVSKATTKHSLPRGPSPTCGTRAIPSQTHHWRPQPQAFAPLNSRIPHVRSSSELVVPRARERASSFSRPCRDSPTASPRSPFDQSAQSDVGRTSVRSRDP